MTDTPLPPSFEGSGLSPEDYEGAMRLYRAITLGDARAVPPEALDAIDVHVGEVLGRCEAQLTTGHLDEDQRQHVRSWLPFFRDIAYLVNNPDLHATLDRMCSYLDKGVTQ